MRGGSSTVISDVVILDLYPWPPRLNSNCVITFKIQFQTQLTGLAALLREGANMVVGCSLLAKIALLTISGRTALSPAYLLGTICSLLKTSSLQTNLWNSGNQLQSQASKTSCLLPHCWHKELIPCQQAYETEMNMAVQLFSV